MWTFSWLKSLPAVFHVDGIALKDQKARINAFMYEDNKEEYLKKSKKINRVGLKPVYVPSNFAFCCKKIG